MSWADDLAGRIRRATRLALNQMGRDGVKFIRWRLNEPYPPASEPYEVPHRRTRELQKAMKYRVRPRATTTADLIYFIDREQLENRTGYNYADDLETGRPSTNLEPRPYWYSTWAMLAPQMQSWFEREFAAKMGQLADAAGDFDSSDAAADFPAEG